MGKMMRYMPMTLIIVLSASLLLALIFIPTLGALFGRPSSVSPRTKEMLEKTEDGEILFKDQRREPLPPWSALPAIDNHEIDEWLDREFFEQGINSDTCAARWYAGDRMDWNLAVGHLF